MFGFSRNFRNQIAVTAVVAVSEGDKVLLPDAGLQDSTAVIHQRTHKWPYSSNVVYGIQIEKAGKSTHKLFKTHQFYQLSNKLSDALITFMKGNFRLIMRSTVDAPVSMAEQIRFVRSIVSWVKFPQMGVFDKSST